MIECAIELEVVLPELEETLLLAAKIQYEKREEILLSLINLRNDTTDVLASKPCPEEVERIGQTFCEFMFYNRLHDHTFRAVLDFPHAADKLEATARIDLASQDVTQDLEQNGLMSSEKEECDVTGGQASHAISQSETSKAPWDYYTVSQLLELEKIVDRTSKIIPNRRVLPLDEVIERLLSIPSHLLICDELYDMNDPEKSKLLDKVAKHRLRAIELATEAQNLIVKSGLGRVDKPFCVEVLNSLSSLLAVLGSSCKQSTDPYPFLKGVSLKFSGQLGLYAEKMRDLKWAVAIENPDCFSRPATEEEREQAISLVKFIKTHCICKDTRPGQYEHWRKTLNNYNRDGKIKLPNAVNGKLNKGQAKRYVVQELLQQWSNYCDEIPSLPQLKKGLIFKQVQNEL